MENVLRLLFDVEPPVIDNADIELKKKYCGGLDIALQYLKYRLKNIREISPIEFILSNEFREHYAAAAVLPVKRIAE